MGYPLPAGTWPPSSLASAPVPARANHRAAIIVVCVVVGALLLAGGAFVVARGLNVGPLKDSGLAACEEIHNQVNTDSNNDDPPTEAEYRAVRKRFSGSRYGDIRDAGTKLIDLLWQLAQMSTQQGADSNSSESAAGAVLLLGGQFVSAYSSLAGACANHGVTIPPISAK